MEPLAEENRKLKEAMKHLEKNAQRSQRERGLAESNALDLEHQKGVLSEQLAAVKEQLRSKFRAAGHCLHTTEGCFRAAGTAAESLRAEERYV